MGDFKPSTREEFDVLWEAMHDAGRKEFTWKVCQVADAREGLIRSIEADLDTLADAARAVVDPDEPGQGALSRLDEALEKIGVR